MPRTASEWFALNSDGTVERRAAPIPIARTFCTSAATYIAPALAAQKLTTAHITPLIHRRCYADAVQLLDSHDVTPIILRQNEWYEPWRLARQFDVIDRTPRFHRYTIDDLRTATTPAARLALAALGAIPWCGADDAERRLLLLRAVVLARAAQ